MSFEIPKTRSEKILQNILGAKNEIEPIQSRIEAILFAILNDTEIGDPYTAPARCEIEKLLVAIKDGGEYNETPLTRSGRILLCKLRGEEYSGTTQSRLEKLFLRWLYELMEITDVPPFTFKSKGNNLIDYDIYGAEDGVGDNEDVTVSGNPISVSDAVEAPATSLQVSFTPSQASTPWIDSEPTTEPYLAKVIPRGNKEYYSLIGATVAWNQLVRNGASDVNESGVMNIPWANGNNNYVMPMNLCHIETVEDAENNSIQVADFESHYVLPFDCVFDEAEAIIAGDTDLAAGDYYFKIVNDSWGNNNGKYVLFTLDADLVAGQQIRKKSGAFNAAIEDCTLGIYTSGSDRTGTALAFMVQTTQPESGTNLGQTDGTRWCNFWHCVVLGCDRWKYSAVRQFLNSDATSGNWWTQQHKWDVMPAYATTKNGFLYGITAGVKEHLKETKVYTARNTVFNGDDTPLGGMDETLDKVFLVALEQSWIEPQESGEGTYWEYYKNLLGTNTPVARSQTYPLLIKYDLAAKTTACSRWMRSCYRGNAGSEWLVGSSGYVYTYSATNGFRVAPCLRIATSDLEYFKGTLNHKYMIKNGTSHFISIADSNSYVNMIKGGNSDMSTDLTLMFANEPAIADYIYSLEQATTGAGVQWLKDNGFLTKDYYPYNPGELISVKTSGRKTVGFNQWDGEWEVGGISYVNGTKDSAINRIRTKNFVPVVSGASYFMRDFGVCACYDADYNWISNTPYTSASNGYILNIPSNAAFIRFSMPPSYGTVYKNDVCLNLHLDGERDGQYEEYKEHTYPLDSDLELHGIPKLDTNNKLYYDGDTYESDGTVTRKYGIVDLGTLTWRYRISDIGANIFSTSINDRKCTKNPSIVCGRYIFAFVAAAPQRIASMDNMQFVAYYNTPSTPSGAVYFKNTAYTDAETFKTAMSGVYLVYELATPTTETATPYTSPIDIEEGGTEEFIDDRTVPVPVGNETYYAAEYAVEGKASVTVNHSATSTDTPTEYEVQFTQQGTVYGGTVDIVTGELTVTWGYIASYNGETLPGEWMSSKDVYASGTTPSTGAEVAYELATPQTYNLTPEQVTMLLGSNYLETEDGTITLTYKDSNIVLPFSVSCGADVNSYEIPLTDKLYKVSAYADSVSYDDQTVKREIIVEKLDGSEEWILSDGVFSTTLTTRARTTAVLCNELTTEQCSIADDLTTLNVTGVPQTSVEEFVAWLQASDVYVQYVRENTLVTPHAVPEVSTFNGTNTFSVDTDVTPSEVTIIYPNRVTTRTLPKTKKIGKSKLMKSK